MDHAQRQKFAEVAADCTPSMIGLAYLLAGSQPAAERALRRALARTARRWGRLEEPPESFILITMCRDETRWWRRLIRRLTRRGTGPEAPDRTGPHPDRPAAAPHRDGPAGAPYRGGLAAAMRRALLDLPPAERVVVVLLHHEGLTVAETAQVLGWSRVAVHRRTEQAEVRLRELLAQLSTPAPVPFEPDPAGRHRDESYV